MDGFRLAIRVLALIALLTGAGDVLVGLSGQQMIGAALEEGYADPLLNSQIRYLGAVWFGFGLLLWVCAAEPGRYAGILKAALWVVFLGGLGRVASVIQFGFPSSDSGTQFVIVAIAIEIIGMPLLLLWQRRLSVASV